MKWLERQKRPKAETLSSMLEKLYNSLNFLSTFIDAICLYLFCEVQNMICIGMCTQWEDYIDAYMQEAEWLAAGYMPTLNEYLQNGIVSCGNRVVTLQPVLSLDGLLPEDILLQIDYPSRFNERTCSALRLRGDTRTFKVSYSPVNALI